MSKAPVEVPAEVSSYLSRIGRVGGFAGSRTRKSESAKARWSRVAKERTTKEKLKNLSSVSTA